MKPIAQLVQNLALIFMIYETIKVFIPKIIWEQARITWIRTKTKSSSPEENQRVFLQRKNPVFAMMGGVYLIFMLLSLFTPWWWVTLLMIGLGTAVTASLKPLMARNAGFSNSILLVLVLDYIFTIGLLSLINPVFINFISNFKFLTT